MARIGYYYLSITSNGAMTTSNDWSLYFQADVTQLTYPSELTTLSSTFEIDVTQPKFYEFGSFSSSKSACVISQINIHNKILELVEVDGRYTAQVKNVQDYFTATVYSFWL